jgi:tRNA(fMet)-specific endonuclease VapC
MAAFLLDTTTLTYYKRKQAAVVAAIEAHFLGGHQLGVRTVNVEETLGGWYNLLRKARTPAAEEYASILFADSIMLMARFVVHPTTVAALARFDALVKLRLNVGRSDLKIAAVALEPDATVVTNNARDFGRVPGLRRADWSHAPL